MSWVVDRVLPAPKETTDAQFTQGIAARKDAREKVLKSKEDMQKNLARWTTAKVAKSAQNAYIKYINDEIAWWNANTDLSPRQVSVRSVAYFDTLSQKIEEIDKIAAKNIADIADSKEKAKLLDVLGPKEKEDIKKQIDEQEGEEARLEQEKNEKIEKYGWQHALWDAFIVVMQISVVIVYILIAIRIAAFAANDYLYMPLPYRILKFAYTFAFMPFFLPYYTWREIKTRIWNSEKPPNFESIFPVIPYDVSEPLTVNNRLFGYRDVDEVKDWIAGKQEEGIAERREALVSTVREDTIKAKEKEMSEQ